MLPAAALLITAVLSFGGTAAAAEAPEPAVGERSSVPTPNGEGGGASGATGVSGAAGGSGSEEPGKPAEKESKGSRVSRASEWMTDLLTLVGSFVLAVLVLAGTVLVAVVAVKRQRASLAVEAFADGGVELKVGSAMAALVEKRLTDLSRAGRRANDGYTLDLVVADVELFATNKSLETALGGLAETSQLKLLVAVLGLVDRLFGSHLVAKGELMPKGDDGYGVVLAMQSGGEGLQARGVLWNASQAEAKSPEPYYELAGPAAAWVQYEAARSLDSRVGLVTGSAKSFSLLSQGLAEHRAGRLWPAAGKYMEALDADRENVAALVNLSLVLAHHEMWFDEAVLLLVRARAILHSRYEELR